MTTTIITTTKTRFPHSERYDFWSVFLFHFKEIQTENRQKIKIDRKKKFPHIRFIK